MDLAYVWAGLIAFAVFAYVILDGFDLGIGILFPFFKAGSQRDQMMNSIAPVWDGNETWLILGGGGLFAAFPLAYATIMPALYIPIIAMLLGLVFRGVAFEYRWRTQRWRALWDISFFLGSIVAALSQGIALGALIQGIEVAHRGYTGGWWDWLTPFSMVTGIALITGYVLLGSCWLMLKTKKSIHIQARKYAILSMLLTLAFLGIVSTWTPFIHPHYFGRWFHFPNILFIPILIFGLFLCFWWFVRSLSSNSNYAFISALGIFTFSFAGLGFTVFPKIVPPSITIPDAAAPKSSLEFMLVGTSILIPIILAYTGYAYWVFRGKVSADEGYH